MLKLFALKSCFVGSSDVFLEAVLWNRIGFLSDPDPEFDDKKLYNFTAEKNPILLIKKDNLVISWPL
jgi:hypothetical protein